MPQYLTGPQPLTVRPVPSRQWQEQPQPPVPGQMAPGLAEEQLAGTSFERARRLLEDAKNDWVEAKKLYGSSAEMLSVAQWRKVLIDARLLELRRRYPGLRIRSVGSANPTSDYDITVSGPGDADAVAEFNASFRREWGKESATVFDVNLYVKDFLPERGNFAFPYAPGAPGLRWSETELLPPLAGDPRQVRSWERTADGWEPAPGGRRLSPETPDSGLVRPIDKKALGIAEADQDVAALTKLRKYLPDADWQPYVDQVLAHLPATARAGVQDRHAAADHTHRQATTELADRLRADTHEVRPATTAAALIEELEHSRPDAVVKARNLLYAKYAAELRTLQARHDADPTDDGLALAIRSQTSYSLWHAMEAYHSEGAVLDVVGKQAKTEVTVTSAHYLQSFNEQFGDLLKDLTHYADSGEAFYRSAKYLQRMTAAARQALERSGAALPDAELALLTQLEEISSADGSLLGIRGGREEYAPATARDKSDIATSIYSHTLAITDKASLRRAVLDLGARINAAVRGA
ncbi:hypothetical protein ACODT5_02185 [Streptomyces sp. 5.8]|uniref:hypothetical protein n=1 Tax=Streptomyces sp. 5.8 TaxID=3406571 RepID=UPI003BB4BC2C